MCFQQSRAHEGLDFIQLPLWALAKTMPWPKRGCIHVDADQFPAVRKVLSSSVFRKEIIQEHTSDIFCFRAQDSAAWALSKTLIYIL